MRTMPDRSPWSDNAGQGSGRIRQVPGDDAQSFELRTYLGVVQRRKALIAVVAVGTAVVALVASFLQTPVYEGNADILVQPRPTESVFSDAQVRSSLGAIETEIEVLASDPILDRVRDRLGTVPEVTAGRLGETEVMQVTARHVQAERAAAIANAYAESYVEFRKAEAVGDLEAASRGIEEKIAELQAEIGILERRISDASSADGSVEAVLQPRYSNLLTQQALLAQKLDELQVDVALKSGGARIVRSAVTPDSPAEPKPVRNGLAALTLGLVLGTGLAFVRESFDDSVKDKKDLGDAVGLPVLGVIPAVREWRRAANVGSELRMVNSPLGEAFRTLRTSIQLLGIERPIRSIQVTSAMAGEGKTSVVSGLALLLAAAGQRVVVVDSDLRRPRLHEVFGVSNEIGLTSAFLGEAELLDVVRRVPGEESLCVLPSGPVPANPSELLSSKRMAELLFFLQNHFDVVVVDSAPLLPVTDSTLVAAWVEATLLVARAGVTTERQLVDAVERLRQVEANLVGTVLNAVDQVDYGYYYSENGAPANGTGKGARPQPRPRAHPQRGVRRAGRG
jgi:succinoglycan biosynthesis transport protein ExoP